MKEKIYNILKLILVILFMFSIGLISNLVLSIFNIDINKLSTKNMVLYQFIASTLIFILTLFIYYKETKKDYNLFKKNNKTNIEYVIKYFIKFIIIKYISGFITTIILLKLGFDENSLTSYNQSLAMDYVKASPFLMLIPTAFLAPLYEELIFRLGFRKVIKNKYLFIITSGVIFGLIHIFPLDEGVSLLLGLVQSITYVTMGIYFSYIYSKTNNIFTTVFIHFLNNFISVLLIIKMFL